MKTKIIIERAMPYWRKLLLIKCDRNVEIETIIKQFKDVGWSDTELCWTIPTTPERFRVALGELRKIGLVDFNSIFNKQPKNISSVAVVVKNKVVLKAVLNEEQSGLLKNVDQWLRSKRYNSNTIKTYTEAYQHFWNIFIISL